MSLASASGSTLALTAAAWLLLPLPASKAPAASQPRRAAGQVPVQAVQTRLGGVYALDCRRPGLRLTVAADTLAVDGGKHKIESHDVQKALTIRQPFAWCAVAGFKPVENRSQRTHYRGPLLIHAGLKWHDTPLEAIEEEFGIRIDRAALRFGGIIGRVDLVDCVTSHKSKWFKGPYGWVFENPRFLDFIPCRGEQTLFNVRLNSQS